MLLDIVFSLDSVITAIGMADDLRVMTAAVVLAVLVMLVAAEPISTVVEHHPTIKVLALSFLLLIGAVARGRRTRPAHPQGLHLLRHGLLRDGGDHQYPRATAWAADPAAEAGVTSPVSSTAPSCAVPSADSSSSARSAAS